MNRLTSEYWTKFKKDGKLFEKLIGELLKAMYPDSNFSHTFWSHDGGKDFETSIPFFDKKQKIWAECKCHKDALPIHDVSMTLLMAYIESAAVILFFSYSPVNNAFQSYIYSYTQKSEKTVKIYADDSLEGLILKYKDNIHFADYFGQIEFDDQINVSDISCKYSLHSKISELASRDIVLHINDTISLEVSIFNKTSSQINVEIELLDFDKYPYFKLLDKNFEKQRYQETISIEANSIGGKTFPLKLIKYSTEIKLPKLETRYVGKSKRYQIKRNLKCRWLAETQMIGRDYKLIKDDYADIFSGINPHIGAIAGSSGTGKSRLLNEIKTDALWDGYSIFSMNADNTNSLTSAFFFKSLIAEMEDIPVPTKMDYSKIELLKSEDTQTSFALKILFDNSIDYKAIKYELVDYLIQKLNQSKYLLLLDNIQFYDEIVIEVLLGVIDTKQIISDSVILLAANVDYVYKDTIADRLLHKMESLKYHDPKHFSFYKVNGFKREEAVNYLQACLSSDINDPDKDNFEYTIALTHIVDSYGTNPLFLQNYLLYLYQKSIITQTNTSCFYISDCQGFQNSI